MKLSNPPPMYSTDYERQRNTTIERADGENLKRGRDIEMQGGRVIIRSANGTRWALTVSDAGAVSATAV